MTRSDAKTYQDGLARRLFLAMLLLSALVSVAWSAWELYGAYKKDLREVDDTLSQIQAVHRHSIADRLWTADIPVLQKELQALLSLAHIRYLAVWEKGRLVASAGEEQTTNYRQRTIALRHPYRNGYLALGELKVQATLEEANDSLWEGILSTFAGNIVQVFLVFGFAFYLFYGLVTRHLEHIARFLGGLSLDSLDRRLVLQRKPQKEKDALDAMVLGVNAMQDRLRMAYENAQISDQRLRIIAENFNGVLWMSDPKERSFLYVSPSCQHFLGCPAQALYEEPISSWLHLVDSSQQEALDALIFGLQAQPQSLAFQIEAAPGQRYWLRARAFPLDTMHAEDGVSLPQHSAQRGGFFEDISDRIAAENERKELLLRLQQHEKMRALGRIAGGIAHDFNNLLATIKGYADLAEMDIDERGENLKGTAHGEFAANLASRMREIRKGASTAQHLVDKLLAFSRDQTQNRIVIDLVESATEIVQNMPPTLRERIAIKTQKAADSLPILAEPGALHQILSNLLVNAEDETPEGGSIGVHVAGPEYAEGHCNACRERFCGDYVRLSVVDEGSGIPQGVQQRIFDPFYSSKGFGKGTGLGLSVVHGLVHSHGGHVLVNSTPRGTTFDILLPMAERARVKAEPVGEGSCAPETVEPKASAARILIVDDEPALGRMMAAVLEKQGYAVESVCDAQEALSLYRESPEAFDLVITDYTMPKLSGAALAKELLKQNPQLPIILCTGYSEAMNEDAAKSLGIAALHGKPLDMGKFINTVSDLLQTR